MGQPVASTGKHLKKIAFYFTAFIIIVNRIIHKGTIESEQRRHFSGFCEYRTQPHRRDSRQKKVHPVFRIFKWVDNRLNLWFKDNLKDTDQRKRLPWIRGTIHVKPVTPNEQTTAEGIRHADRNKT
jgi:hypothetical protein